MRVRIQFACIALAVVFSQMGLQAATVYRYAALINGDLYLISADGKGKLPLAKHGKDTCWQGFAVSPVTGHLVGVEYGEDSFNGPTPNPLYEIDPSTGSTRLITQSKILQIPYNPVWLGDGSLLVERADKQGIDAGVYAVNTGTGALRRVVPPSIEEWNYDRFSLSPSGTLLATFLNVTAGEWISVNMLSSGKQLWRTDSNHGFSGFSAAVWSADSKWLYVALYRDDEMASDSPGGLWKMDAHTGKMRPWKYRGRSLDGLYASPNHQVLVLDWSDKVECLRASDGKTLFKKSMFQGIFGVVFLEENRLLVCGVSHAVELDVSGRQIKIYKGPRFPTDTSIEANQLRYSPNRKEVMYGLLGTLNLATGKAISFSASKSVEDRIEWLKEDVVR